MEQINLTNELCIIEVSGIDSPKFLQGQLTNDIMQLNKNGYQSSAHLNNKGRMLASFIITSPKPDTYYLITPKEIIDSILPRLKMFVLRSKVNITPSNATIIFSDHIITDTNTTIALATGYYLSITEQAPDALLYDILVSDVNKWKEFLITHGIPLIYSSTQESFIPQHVNYDLLGGINFKKGCYTGQEIVARTHYLGKVKRRMYHFTYNFSTSTQENSNCNIKVGQIVISPKLNNQEVGIIVEILKQENSNYIGLVSLQTDCIDATFLDVDNQQQLHIEEINY